jgi:hypothetical protein
MTYKKQLWYYFQIPNISLNDRLVKETLEVLPLFPMPSPKRPPKDHNNNDMVVTFKTCQKI